MAKYKVKIIQRGEMDIVVDAESEEDAMHLAAMGFEGGNILMTDEHWDDMEYQAREVK